MLLASLILHASIAKSTAIVINLGFYLIRQREPFYLFFHVSNRHEQDL